MSQHEMACWLEYERGVQVSQSTISRYREEISRFPADLNLSLTRKLAGGIWHMRLLGMRRDILRLFGVERPGVSLQQ